MGAVQKIVSIGIDKALTLSRPKINAPAKSPSSRLPVYFTCGVRSSVKTGDLPDAARHGRLQPQNRCGSSCSIRSFIEVSAVYPRCISGGTKP